MNSNEDLAGYDDLPLRTRGAAVPVEVAPVSSPEAKRLLSVVVASIVIAALYLGKDVLIPITLAVMLSFVLAPLVNFLRGLGLWRAPAVGISVCVALGVLALLGTLIGSQASALASDAPAYVRTIEHKVLGVQALAAARLAAVTSLLGRPSGEPAAPVVPAPRSGASTAAAPKPLLVEMAEPPTSALVVARTIVEPVLAPLETTVIVLVVAVFILFQREDLRDRFIRLFGSHDLHRTTMVMDDAGQRLSRYFASQLGVNASFGLVIGLGLWGIGIPSPALWGVLAGLLRFVPYIGAMMAAVAPLTLSAAIDPGWSLTAYTALLFVVVEPLTGYVVEPLLYGHSTGLSPVSVIIAAVFWTWIWGPIGLILSTPLTLCLVVMGRHVRSLEFLDVLLGDRPALSEVKRLYQRTLAGDPDEALDQAEAMLADRSLLDYYDSVALPALMLAEEDHARGTVTHERAMEMTKSMLAVIDELDEHVDAGDGISATRTVPVGTDVVACIAGRGSFDEAVAAMLAQLLTQRGVATRRVPHAAVSREAIGALNLSGVRLIALSYLELTGSPAHLRHLARRLRQRAPEVPIVVGLWRAGESVLSEAEAQTAIGAEHYVTSLRAAVESALAAIDRQPSDRS